MSMCAGDPETISPEELELALHLQRGATLRQISERLGLSTSEVAERIVLLLRKLKTRSREELHERITLLTEVQKHL